MPTSNSSTHAADAREIMRHLARSSRRIEDPGEVHDLLRDISLALNSMAQALHQIARVHDNLEHGRARVAGSARTGQATSYAVSWEVHRSAEILTQAAAGVDRACQNEARIAYAPPDPTLNQPLSGDSAVAGRSIQR